MLLPTRIVGAVVALSAMTVACSGSADEAGASGEPDALSLKRTR